VGSSQSSAGSHGLSALGKLFMQIYSLIARNPHLFAVSQKLAALGTHLVSPFSQYVHLPVFTGWGYSKDLPRFAGKTFRDRWDNSEKNVSRQVNTDTDQQLDRYTGKQATDEQDTKTSVTIDKATLVSRFAEELIKVNGNVIHTDTNELSSKVIDFLQSRHIDHIHLEPNVLDESAFEKAGITVSHAADAALRVGVTKALCGLADTGSILIADGKGEPLKASLLPQIHIAVLCTSDILPTLANAMRLPAVRKSRSSVVITGPSRTADIEMSLTIGMHGPGELDVFLVHTICYTAPAPVR
jgi:L-lactate utilization protein LutC